MIIAGVTINRKPSYDSGFSFERFGQTANDTVDGYRSVYNRGSIERLHGVISLKAVDSTEAEALRTALRGTVDYQTTSFTIDITGLSNTDIGAGKGVSLSGVYWDGGTDFDGNFKRIPPGKYDITVPYWKNI